MNIPISPRDIADLLVILDQAVIRGSQAMRMLELKKKLLELQASLSSGVEPTYSDRSCSTDESAP